METYFIKKGGALLPVDAAAQERLAKIKDGEVFGLTLRRNRSVQHHRRLWSHLHRTVENTKYFSAEEQLLDYIKIELKKYKIYKIDGKVYTVPASISFTQMGQDEFNDFYNKAVEICAELLGVKVHELENQFEG